MWEGRHLSLWILAEQAEQGSKEPTEWTIAISRKTVRLATQRNRWKRRIREVLRRYKDSVRPGHTVRLKVHQGGKEIKYSELEQEMLELMSRSGVFLG